MNPEAKSPPTGGGAAVWWAIWAVTLFGLVLIYVFIGRKLPTQVAPPNLVIDLFAFGLLTTSCLLRWLILPRIKRAQQAFVLFVAGLALAEGCGIIGIFLTGVN
ncbi:MAG: hypothetical protein A3G75_10620 [Verrucomicrobia bacterium RIFCSPLOWO2_12_FULL_64_8]|nr:MAG: hypothetical protein A3G75_10620 [Verrucomicrobia bacterium RIFCSPLOWO2_12_FULL_64_8]